jgi:hypothetical protein
MSGAYIHGNTSVGENALIHAITGGDEIGDNNTAFGKNALYLLQPGRNESTALGAYALSGSIDGENTAVGAYAAANGSGINLTAVGNWALRYSAEGNDNTAVGYRSMSGDLNTQIDPGNRPNGSCNTALGSHTLQYSPDGDHNTGVGYNVLNSLVGLTAERNTGIGSNSLKSLTKGADNSTVGEKAGTNVTTGCKNTLIGGRTGKSITTGCNNTVIGYGADVDLGTGSYRTAIGADSFVTKDNSIVIGRKMDSVGIGTTSPQATLDVKGGSTQPAFNVTGGTGQPAINVVGGSGAPAISITPAAGQTAINVVGGSGSPGVIITGGSSSSDPALSVTGSSSGSAISVTGGTGSTQSALSVQASSGPAATISAGTSGEPALIITGTTVPSTSAAVEISSSSGSTQPALNVIGSVGAPAVTFSTDPASTQPVLDISAGSGPGVTIISNNGSTQPALDVNNSSGGPGASITGGNNTTIPALDVTGSASFSSTIMTSIGSATQASLGLGSQTNGIYSTSGNDISITIGGTQTYEFNSSSFAPTVSGIDLGTTTNHWDNCYLDNIVTSSITSDGLIIGKSILAAGNSGVTQPSTNMSAYQTFNVMSGSPISTDPVLTYSGDGGFGANGGFFTVGYAFTANATMFVSKLKLGATACGSGPVGLYTSTGTLLVSTNISTGDPLIGFLNARDVSNAGIILSPGSQYLVAANPIASLPTVTSPATEDTTHITLTGTYINPGGLPNVLTFPTMSYIPGTFTFGTTVGFEYNLTQDILNVSLDGINAGTYGMTCGSISCSSLSQTNYEFYGYQTSSQSIGTGLINEAPGVIDVATTDNFSFTSGNSSFLAPIDGWYSVSGCAKFTANGTGTRRATVSFSGQIPGEQTDTEIAGHATNQVSVQFSAQKRLTSGDTIQIMLFQDSGISLTLTKFTLQIKCTST